MPVKHDVFKYISKCGKEECNVLYYGDADGIHFWKLPTAICAEVGHKFLNQLVSGGTTFTRFCDDMTSTYKSYNKFLPSFLSVHTFIDWFFHFAASMDIDFRRSIDPWCGHDPRYLACDGTHVGIPIKNVNIVGIETPEEHRTVQSQHLRYDRCFLPYRDHHNKEQIKKARANLLDLCNFYLNRGGAKLNTEELVCIINSVDHDDRCSDFIFAFIHNLFPAPLCQAVSCFMKLLLGDAAVSTVIYFRKVDDFRLTINHIATDFSHLDNIIDVKPELKNVIIESKDTDFFPFVCQFILYLCDIVEEMHLHDADTTPPVPIPGTYNPESGVSYYFTEHGEQLRRLPKYAKDKYDNETDFTTFTANKASGDGDVCTKNYTATSPHGWSHLFLWFCPIHGHCYGFHIINRAEGRKDAFASAMKFMTRAPDELYYDYSCSLSEYCLNREPSFFSRTRCWFDIFHSFNHKCGDNHKCVNVPGLFHTNTSICEQFNSYLNNIKYIATHLSQSHFCFLVQIMIHRWNDHKTALHKRKMTVLQENFDAVNMNE